jgi:hypothetical protein
MHLDQLLEDITVDLPVRADELADRPLTDWHPVSTEEAGGVIAYFSEERLALAFRLMLINMTLNGQPRKE